MVHETIEAIIALIVFVGMISLWLALGHMVFLAYCPNICGLNRSECHEDKSPAIFYITNGASETSESSKEGHSSSIVSLLNNQYSV